MVTSSGSFIGSTLGSNELYVDRNTIGISLGDTYVASIGISVDLSYGVIVGEDMGIIYGNIWVRRLGGS